LQHRYQKISAAARRLETVDNDVVLKTPVRKSHKPVYRRQEKPTWSPAQVLAIMQGAPQEYRAF
jgi:hypothetical protein